MSTAYNPTKPRKPSKPTKPTSPKRVFEEEMDLYLSPKLMKKIKKELAESHTITLPMDEILKELKKAIKEEGYNIFSPEATCSDIKIVNMDLDFFDCSYLNVLYPALAYESEEYFQEAVRKYEEELSTYKQHIIKYEEKLIEYNQRLRLYESSLEDYKLLVKKEKVEAMEKELMSLKQELRMEDYRAEADQT